MATSNPTKRRAPPVAIDEVVARLSARLLRKAERLIEEANKEREE